MNSQLQELWVPWVDKRKTWLIEVTRRSSEAERRSPRSSCGVNAVISWGPQDERSCSSLVVKWKVSIQNSCPKDGGLEDPATIYQWRFWANIFYACAQMWSPVHATFIQRALFLSFQFRIASEEFTTTPQSCPGAFWPGVSFLPCQRHKHKLPH